MSINTYEQQSTEGGYGRTFTTVNIRTAQNWTPTLNYSLSQIQIMVNRPTSGTPSDLAIDVYIANAEHHPTGNSLGQAIILGTDINGTDSIYYWETAIFSTPIDIAAGIEYCFVGKLNQAILTPAIAINHVVESLYSAGFLFESIDAGVSWIDRTPWDFAFKIQGNPTVAPPASDSYTTKRLVCCASSEVWIETVAGGTMEQLTDSIGLLDTSDFISMFEIYGKAFIVNGSIKKAVDLINTKLTTADIKPTSKVIPLFGTVVTGATSGASMIVGYIDATDSTCNVYGKRTTVATFTSGETVKGTITSTDDVTFVLSAAEDAPPHFYNWTVYSGDTTTYGSIPDKVTLGCNYRGRAVIAGDPIHPHQWYMSRQGNPFNFLYGENDPLSAVAGNNADAGEVGDIITALIPYGDDFLIFGGANSIYLLDGDPCSGGSIDQIDNCTGIYGSQAWCKDNQGNLYFYGSGGLYKMVGGREKPVNISYGALPKLVDDWAAEPATHRIVLSFDPIRNGIIVSRTTLASGANLNYWYDLKIEGFFPETYPNVCGIFSSFNYNSNESTTRKLLFGCADGYLRSFSDSAKDDDTGETDTAISSYTVIPLVKMNEADDSEGKLISLIFESAGGAASGAFGDTDGFSYELHAGDDAETVLEDIKDGATARESGTLTGTGRKNCIRTKVRGRWLGIKLYNSTITQTWVVNLLTGIITPAGKIK